MKVAHKKNKKTTDPKTKVWSHKINDWIYRTYDSNGKPIYVSIPE